MIQFRSIESLCMKKIIVLLCTGLVLLATAKAQSPGRFNYQAIARDNTGAVIANRAITIHLGISDIDPDGSPIYSETFSLTTNALGLFTVAVGSGTVVSGNFAAINWALNSKFLKTEIDFGDGRGMQLAGISQLLSVPYALFAQNTGGDGAWPSSGIHISNGNTGNVGIGTTAPLSKLHIKDGSVLFSGVNASFPVNPNPPPLSGMGSRQFWYADTGAFRTGGVDNNTTLGNDIFDLQDGTHYWDKDSIGIMSFAAGYNNIARGAFSTSIGAGSIAYGPASFVAGVSSMAVNSADVAIGSNSVASGGFSIALGERNKVTGTGAFAAGNSNTASGTVSTALGNNANTNGHTGAFVIGDASGLQATADADNEFKALFTGGYVLVTSQEGRTEKGAVILKGDVSWSVLSDSTAKTSFLPADGENFLSKFNGFNKLGSWVYRGQDPATQRHYGPMAQDFHAAFGYDGTGTSGNKTMINSSDMSGVLFIAVRALVKRTDELKEDNESLRAEIQAIKKQIAALKSAPNH